MGLSIYASAIAVKVFTSERIGKITG